MKNAYSNITAAHLGYNNSSIKTWMSTKENRYVAVYNINGTNKFAYNYPKSKHSKFNFGNVIIKKIIASIESLMSY